MICKGNHVKFARFVLFAVCEEAGLLRWSKKERNSSMCNKTIIRCDFCDFQNNQGLSKDYQPKPNPYLDLDYSGYHKNLIQ